MRSGAATLETAEPQGWCRHSGIAMMRSMLRILGIWLSALAVGAAVTGMVLAYQHLQTDPQRRETGRYAELSLLQTTVFLTERENSELHWLLYAAIGGGGVGALLLWASRKLED